VVKFRKFDCTLKKKIEYLKYFEMAKKVTFVENVDKSCPDGFKDQKHKCDITKL